MTAEILRGIVVGDYESAPYHPISNVQNRLQEILKDKIELIFTEDREIFNYENLKQFKLCILYIDAWNKRLSQKQISGILTYVSNGGGLLVIHNAISYDSNAEFAQLIGARFTGHPPYQKLIFKTEPKDHPILYKVKDFEMEEELYTFEFDNFSDHEVLLYASNGEMTIPAAWTKEYGEGRIIYLAPGHDIKSFNNETFSQLIINSALYLISIL